MPSVLELPAREPIIDRACVLSASETGQVNVMKLMVVALAGWINEQQEDVIDYLRILRRRGGGLPRAAWRLGGLLRYYYRDSA